MTVLPVYVGYALAYSVVLWVAGHRGRRNVLAPVTVPKAKRLLIVGATGGSGRHLVRQALEREYAVTVLVRRGSDLAIEDDRLTRIVGDVLDQDCVDRAMEGQDAVLSALGHKRFFYPTRILSNGTRNILQSMRAHGVTRLVCETAMGLGDSAGRLGLLHTLFVVPVVLPFYFWDKARQERLVAASAAAWTLVRPVTLTDGAARGGCRVGPESGSLILTRSIARADVAKFMIDQLDSGEYVGQAIGLSG